MQNFEPLFKKIIRNKKLHACFLNTLSLMELLGAHKLSRLVPFLGHKTSFLEHVSEEFRHAYFLRTLAQKIGEDAINSYDALHVIALHKSRTYINHMHRHVCLLLKQEALNDPALFKWRVYLLSTLAIETRALPFYEAYQNELNIAGLRISVKSVIAEEANHLAEIKKLIESDPPLGSLIEPSLTVEKRLFNRWLNMLQSEIFAVQAL